MFQKHHNKQPQCKTKYTFHTTILYLSIITILLHHVLADDDAVMAKLAKGLSPTPSGWSGSNPCQWTGVQCDKSGQVISITLASKSLSGELPPELNQLSSLTALNLQGNQFSGTLPALSNLASLQEVYLDDNNFTSISSGFLSGLTNLRTFSISQNSNLSPWTIPESLTNSSNLGSFQASKANIMGTIPDIFGALSSLQNLTLSYNNLTGSLPGSFAKSGIQKLWLNNQVTGLSGGLDVLGTMPGLVQAWVHVNKFTGPVPDLSSCKNLFDIQLRDNQLTGVIPDSLTSLPKLANVSLQNNMFQGPVPSFPKNVQVSLGNTNSFCIPNPGPCDAQVTTLLEAASALRYPQEIAQSWKGNDPCDDWRYISCESGSVTVVNFAKQKFVGTISPAIANLTSLKSLILSDNKLTGVIPATLTNLKNLQILDITNNNISGKVPEFGPNVAVKTGGNPFIGIDLPSSSSYESASNGNKRRVSIAPWMIAVITVVVIIIVVMLGSVVYKRHVEKRRKDYKSVRKAENREKTDKTNASENTTSINSPSSDFQVTNGVSVTIPKEVLEEATNNFSKDNIIGEGGFGIVYKGQLHDGTLIAVKRMEYSLLNHQGISEFQAEIEVLSKVRHRNLVALHGFCVHGNDRLLVYEYMPQGSLEHHLFRGHQKGNPQLTWRQRVSIALDVARGVEYLHSLAQQSFIHRDLKPSNILLGDDMRAKVSDFGLVKSAPDGKYSMQTKLAGTFGYLAPEYAATGRVTTKVDVFAFGVILMELITGQKALDNTLPEERCHLVTWFRNVVTNTNNLIAALDPALETDEENFKSICTVAELAGHCTAREPSQRPDMGHAVNVLSPLVVQWTPHSKNEDNYAIDLHMTLPEALERWKANEDKYISSYL